MPRPPSERAAASRVGVDDDNALAVRTKMQGGRVDTGLATHDSSGGPDQLAAHHQDVAVHVCAAREGDVSVDRQHAPRDVATNVQCGIANHHVALHAPGPAAIFFRPSPTRMAAVPAFHRARDLTRDIEGQMRRSGAPSPGLRLPPSRGPACTLTDESHERQSSTPLHDRTRCGDHRSSAGRVIAHVNHFTYPIAIPNRRIRR